MENAKFYIGQIIFHKKFNYRGVIIDVDTVFSGTEQWYNQVALSRPPKDKPWYHVIVENSNIQTYVAERHLELDKSGKPVNNLFLKEFFVELKNGVYIKKDFLN